MTFENYDRILSGRLTIWDTAGHMVINRPWTGVGAGMFAATYDRYSTRTDDPFRTGGSFGSPFHAHNVYLSIAAETGLLGLLGIITAFILCVKWYYTASLSRREQAWPYAFGLLIALFPTSIEFTLYKHWFFPVPLLLLCATLAALGYETADEKAPASTSQK
jgi:putative inorganic carbon (HCO3(-)) transporter